MLGLYLIYYVVCEGKDNTGVQCLKIRILLALQSNLLSNFTFLAWTTLTCFYSVCTLCLCNTLWRALDELPSCVNPNLSYSKAWRPCFIFIIQRNYKYIVISCRASFSQGDVPHTGCERHTGYSYVSFSSNRVWTSLLNNLWLCQWFHCCVRYVFFLLGMRWRASIKYQLISWCRFCSGPNI